MGAKVGDGDLHMFLLRKKSRFRTIKCFIQAMSGSHLKGIKENTDDGKQPLILLRGKSVEVQYEQDKKKAKKQMLCTDGEIKEIPDNFQFSMNVTNNKIPF